MRVPPGRSRGTSTVTEPVPAASRALTPRAPRPRLVTCRTPTAGSPRSTRVGAISRRTSSFTCGSVHSAAPATAASPAIPNIAGSG